ncbi:hypothetical protein PC116_g31531 [Phytophthora cactorum]|nr:hypothetical protein PC116_g31531 [Phytophthora cactorum]
MSDNKTVVLVTSAVGLGVVAILSVPAALNLSRLRSRGPKCATEIYEDKDGKSTPEAVKAFSTKVPKAVMLVLSLIGFGLSVALAVISTLGTQGIESGLFLANWLAVIIWVSSLLHMKNSGTVRLLTHQLHVDAGLFNLAGHLCRG